MNHQEFNILLKKVIGQKILKINSGGCTGSVFTFEIGTAIHLNEKIEGQYSFMIECAWRLEDVNEIITTWREDSEIDSSMVKGLELLAGETISNIELSKFYDIEMFFGSGKKLFVFCDYTDVTDFESNWFFRDQSMYYTIDNKFNIEIERSTKQV